MLGLKLKGSRPQDPSPDGPVYDNDGLLHSVVVIVIVFLVHSIHNLVKGSLLGEK